MADPEGVQGFRWGMGSGNNMHLAVKMTEFNPVAFLVCFVALRPKTYPHSFFLCKLEQAVSQYFAHAHTFACN